MEENIMSLSIRSNVGSLTAQRHLMSNNKAFSLSMERLSSGYRVNRAADDAAGLAISENMRSQIRSLNQAKRNANDGISLIQTAEGSLIEVSSILVRMRELSTQSANDTLADRDRTFLNSEYSMLKDEIDRIASSTEFNGKQLLNGAQSADGVVFQIGINNQTYDRLTVTIADTGVSSIGDGNSVDSTDILSRTNSQTAMDSIDAAINDISEVRSKLGAYQNRLSSTIVSLSNSSENLTAANSRIRDVDVAEESAAMTRNQILVNSTVSMLSQANQSPNIALQLLQG